MFRLDELMRRPGHYACHATRRRRSREMPAAIQATPGRSYFRHRHDAVDFFRARRLSADDMLSPFIRAKIEARDEYT